MSIKNIKTIEFQGMYEIHGKNLTIQDLWFPENNS